MESLNYKPIWEELIKNLKQSIPANEMEVWINQIQYVKSEQGSILVGVPSAFVRDTIKKRYISKFEKTIEEICGNHLSIEVEVYSNLNEVSQSENTSINTNITITQETHSITEPIREQTQVSTNTNEKFNKENFLKSDFTFESFVESDLTTFAYNAAYAVAKNPGKAYNPFLIYGGVGLGKTHLMQAIGNKIRKEKNLRVLYITAEDFMNEFNYSLKDGTIKSFKDKYRNKTDVLLIDDIHFFSKKTSAQEELFYTFEALTKQNKAIVFTCDRTLEQLKDVSERLLSRFGSGLQADLKPPVYETRYAILLKKLEEENEEIEPEIIDLIAKNISTNVRDLKAALIKVLAYAELTKKKLTLEIAKDLLKDFFGISRKENFSIDSIIKIIAEHYNISSSEIKGKKRNKNIVLPRQLAMYIVREITDFSTTEIGSEFGGRDHTTVMHACQKVEELLITDPTMDSTIQLLIKEIKSKSIKS